MTCINNFRFPVAPSKKWKTDEINVDVQSWVSFMCIAEW